MKSGVTTIFRALVALVLVKLLVACGGAPAGNTSDSVDDSRTPTIAFTSVSESQLVLRGQGGVENSIVTFLVTDAANAPLANQSVEFSLSTDVGGINFVGGDTVTSSSDGQVSVIVQSGSFPIAVQVIATIAGTTTRAVSNEIQISTSIFSAGDFSIGPNPEDISGSDNGANIVNGGAIIGNTTVGMTVLASDQFGHAVLDGSRVTVVTPENGLVDPSTCEMSGGSCNITWASTQPGADKIGLRVTVLAYASGAEEFTDLNSNNIYELNEPFDDLPEAFVDANENGVYDQGELFIDNNSNGVYDATGNGFWDGPCVDIEGESTAERDARCAGDDSTIISDSTILLLAIDTEDP